MELEQIKYHLENIERPDADFETWHALRLPISNKLTRIKTTSRPEYLLMPVENGGQVCVEFRKFKKDKYLGLKNYFIKFDHLPIDVINPIINRMGIGPTITDSIIPDKIECRKEIDYIIQQLLHGSKKGIKLVGPVGTGKTTIFAYIIQQLLTKSQRRISPKDIAFMEFHEIIERMKDYKHQEEIESLMKRKYLFLDELFQGQMNESQRGKFHFYFNERYKFNHYITFVASNKSHEQLQTDQYRTIYSRICDSKRFHQVLEIGGEDKRQMHIVINPARCGDLTGFLDDEEWQQWFYINYEQNHAKGGGA